jgi:eukaryotic-like serine/threonine-protein kinase
LAGKTESCYRVSTGQREPKRAISQIGWFSGSSTSSNPRPTWPRANTVDATTEKKKIGKYEITGILGRGGMGVVYRAEDKRIGRLVAIKTLTEGFSGQPEMLERFYREAQAGILQHPNIVIVYDLGDEDGVPFIVMEFVEGEPLDKLISSGRQISIVEKLGIIEQVCAALGYAHQRGVVHRDIKPANVMVQPNGHAKLVDFGIARVQSSKGESGLTRTGNVIGTIHYIAPERLKGRPFDGRSDIFSTGVMLYLLLTGQLPFTGEDMAVLQKLVNDPHPPLGTFLSNYPPALDAIIDRALAKDPDQRYSTAEEFANDLHAVGEELKKGQVVGLFNDAERLTAEQQFGRAREILLQLVRIDPQHTGARQLLGIVQQNLAQLQRAEQVRQLIAEAEEAAASSRFAEALNSLDQAIALDPANAQLKARFEAIKEEKRRYDEIGSLVRQADSLRERGDLTGALNAVEKALQLNQQDTRIRALHAEISRQAKIAAQQNQIRELMGNARVEVSSRRFTAAIEILREVGKLDPSLPEMESLLQTAMAGQEQERRRKLLDQIEAEIERCLTAEEYDRATELADRAVEQLPSEASLLQLKTRVALLTRQFRTRKLVDSTTAKAQEAFLQSPGEALLIVQKALQELPGEERLLALEDSLRQRLKAREKEEVRGRYLREAQDAIGASQFEKAVEILESYQLEFADAAGVGELLESARKELAQQKRRTRIAATVSQARELLLTEQFEQAIHLLEPAVAETADPTLARLLEDARGQRESLLRKSEALMGQILRHRERGQLEEAISLLQAMPASAVAGSPQHKLLADIRAEKARNEATRTALATAAQATDLAGFNAAIESLRKVQRAWGDTSELSKAVAGIESRRTQLANEAVARSVESARAALLESDTTGAVEALKGSAMWFEFADASQQGDWKRLNAEAGKPVVKRATASIPTVSAPGEIEVKGPHNKLLIPWLAGGLLLVAALGVGLWFHSQGAKPGSQQTISIPTPPPGPPPAAATGTLIIKGGVDKGSPENVQVIVDGAFKGLTQSDGTAKLLLDPGPHSIRFIKSGYSDSQPTSVTIAANAQQTMRFTLTQTVGAPPPPPAAFITIQSVPGALVSIDNAPQGNTDPHGVLNLQVKPGQHALGISLSGYQSFNQSVNLKNGAQQTVYASLPPIPKSTPAPTPNPLPVQIAFYASSSTIQEGQSTTLNWQINNATEVSIDNGIGTVSATGQREVSPSSNTTYQLTASGNGGTQQKTVSIVVEPKATPQPAPPVVTNQPVDERALVQALVNSFNSALSSHNVSGMQAIWPGMPSKDAKGWQSLFKGSPKAQVSQSCSPGALTISGDTATWSCSLTTVIPGASPQRPAGFRFSFAKKNGNWVVTDWRD